MRSKKRKKQEQEHEDLGRWLVSYADFITLLFAFFVTMYAISRVDTAKLGSAVESLQRALGSVIAVQNPQRSPGVFVANLPQRVHITPIEGGKGYPSKSEIENFEKLINEIKTNMKGLSQYGNPKNCDLGKGGTGNELQGMGNDLRSLSEDQIKFIIEKRGLVIRVSERLFFESGDASIRPEFIPMLNVLAKAFENIPNHVRVEGHTDSVPINTPKFPSNWELSTARATTIVRHLLANYSLRQERLSATGYAEFHPIESNRTRAGRLQNRRVDFVVMSNREMEDEPQTFPPAVKPSEKMETSPQDPV
jgi:chemotaxis protein MotB